MTDGLLGQLVDLSNPAWVHELRDPHTGEWIDSPTAAEFPHPEPGKPGTVGRYKVPDPRRLFTKTGYKNPADHPFWKAHPPSVQNILDFYDRADAGTREQGRAWYRQIHDLAGTYIAPGNPEAGGILLSNYSSQTSWPIDMMNAARSWERGRGIGKGEGVIATDQQAAKANRAIAGEGIDKLMTTAKTHSFGLLIKQGDDSPDDPYGHVVIDTHAANLATGGHLRGELLNKAPINDARQHEYVADFYRQAAKIISEREGKLMKPHELQAITWLVQQHANQVYDDAVVAGKAGTPQEQRLSKGRRTMTKNAWRRWVAYAQGQGMKLKTGVSAPLPQMMTAELMAQQIIEMAGQDSLLAQLLDLAFWQREPRDLRGEWTDEPGTGLIEQRQADNQRRAADLRRAAGQADTEFGAQAYSQGRFHEYRGREYPTVTLLKLAADAMGKGAYGEALTHLRQARRDIAALPAKGSGTAVYDGKRMSTHDHLVKVVEDNITHAEESAGHLPDYQKIAGMERSADIGLAALLLDLAGWERERRVPRGMPGAGRWVRSGIAEQLFSPVPAGHQQVLPGMTEPGKAERVRQSLEQAISADHEADTKPGANVTFETPGNYYFGRTADTDIASFADGSAWVRKRGISEDSMHREIAYSRVSDVLGAGAPEVVEHTDPETGKPSIWMPYVNGQTAIEWTDGYDPEEAQALQGGTAYEEYDENGAYIGQKANWSGHNPDEMYRSPQGLLIGLADMITTTEDRHLGNWMIKDGQPVPIDNDGSFQRGAWPGTPFANALADSWESPGGTGMIPAQWDQWAKGLQGLEGEFDAMGMREEWQNLLLNLREVRGMVSA